MEISYIFTYIIMAILGLMLSLSLSAGFIETASAANIKNVHHHQAGHKISKPKSAAVKLYTVQHGDSVYKLCHKYNIKPQEFYRINPLHSATLIAGEEVFVPKDTLLRLPGKHVSKPKVKNQEVINYISTVASTVKQQQSTRELITTAKLQAMSIGNAALSNWFSKYGTARISLMSGTKFSSLSPEAELLLPIYDKARLLIFTQDGVHSTDGRKQVNLGVGGRYFMDASMVGLNSFFDHDFSGGYSRLGFGVEYWRNYLKLIANSYLRISNWQKTADLPGYAARPANGWDLRVNAYLPALPQLGAELGIEKYYGKNVALADKSDFLADPYGVTLGVNYTPVPLITFNAAYKKYQNNKNQMSLGVALNYKLGMNFADQLKPNAVDKMRRLPNNRYDLVERNNNIVLEYQRISDFSLQLSKNIIDVPLIADSQASFKENLQLNAHSSSGFSSIGPDLSFTDDEYKKDGGAISFQGCKLSSNTDAFCDIVVSAPIGEVTPRSTKNYLIKLVGKDAKKATAVAEFTIKVTADPKAYRVFKINPEEVPIKVPPVPQVFYDSSSLVDKIKDVPVKLDLQLLDIHHKPVVRADVAFVAEPVNTKYQALSHHFKYDDVSEVEPGHYVSNLYATAKIFGNLDKVAYRLMPVINKEKDVSLAHTVNFIKIIDNIPNGEVGNSQLLVAPSKIPADGTTPATITFIAKNAEQEDLPELLNSLRLVIDGKDKSGYKVASNKYQYTPLNANGNIYTATLTSKAIATYSIKMQFKDHKSGVYRAIENLPVVQLEAVAPIADSKNSSFTMDKNIIYDNGDSAYATTISAILKDKNKKLLLNQKKVAFFDELDKVTVPMHELGNGEYTAKYTSKHAGEHRLYLMPEPEIAFKDKEIVISVEPSIPYDSKNLKSDKTIRDANDYPDDNAREAKIELSAIGARGGIPLRYLENRLRLHITGKSQTESPPIQEGYILLSPKKDSNIYNASFTNVIAGDYTAQLQYKGPDDNSFRDVANFKIGLKLVSDHNIPHYQTSSMTFNPGSITGSIKVNEQTVISVIINDKYGNRIIGNAINARVRRNMQDRPADTSYYHMSPLHDIDNKGVYTATFQAKVRGQYSFDLLMGDKNFTGIEGQHSIQVNDK